MALSGKSWLLGVDAGGTRTRAWLARAGDPATLRAGEAGGANWSAAPLADCAAAVEAAAAAAAAGEEPELAAVCVCAAGYSPPDHREATLAWLRERWPKARLRMETDLLAAWAGAFGGEPGSVVVAGTGSVAYGRNANGAEARAGGWGPLIDDVGGGYWLGLEALGMVARAADGRGPHTQLVERVVGKESPEAFLRRVITEAWDPPRVASLAKPVLQTARHPETYRLLCHGLAALAALAAAVERQLRADGESPKVVALTGGLPLLSARVGKQPPLREQFEETLLLARCRARLVDPLGPPALGALLLAAEAAGGEEALEQARKAFARRGDPH